MPRAGGMVTRAEFEELRRLVRRHVARGELHSSAFVFDDDVSYTFDGTNRRGRLSNVPSPATDCWIELRGRVLEPTTDYVLTGRTFTTTRAERQGPIRAFYRIDPSRPLTTARRTRRRRGKLPVGSQGAMPDARAWWSVDRRRGRR